MSGASTTGPSAEAADAGRKAAADAAADDLRPLVKRHSHEKYPWLYFREEEAKDSRAKVEQSWLEDPSNAQFKERPRQCYAVIFTDTSKPGPLPAPYPSKLMVIVALGDLHKDNGLPASAQVERLVSGQDLVLEGDSTIHFSGRGGGLALLLIIDK